MVALVSTIIRMLSSSAIEPTCRYIESKELLINIGIVFIRQRKMRKKNGNRGKRMSFIILFLNWVVDVTTTT